MKQAVAPLCLAAVLILAACSRDGGTTRTETPAAATPPPIAPTAPGILNPPRTAQATAAPAARSRAESFLRRIAPTEADVPANAELAPRPDLREGPPPATGSAGPMYSYETNFNLPGGGPVPSGGLVLGVRHTGFAFPDVTSAQANFETVSQSLAGDAAGGLLNRVTDPRTERISDLELGEEWAAWRASGPGAGSPGMDAVRWAVAVRRGPAIFTLIVDGAGGAPDVLARDLARRLDQRLAAALAAGAWP